MPEPLRLAVHSMACRWELLLWGDDLPRLRAAGEEALAEIGRAEQQLSAFLPGSEISLLNSRAGGQPVRVGPVVFGLLEQCRELSRLTGGAFDVTCRPLLAAWGLRGPVASAPSEAEVAGLLEQVGAQRVELDPSARTVRLPVGFSVDLGAVGKGHAVDEAMAVLDELGVERALLHGGTSIVAQRGPEPLQIALPDGSSLPLGRACLSLSGGGGRTAVVGGRTVSHVIDPRSGRPVEAAGLTAVLGPSALVADALSTALLVLGAEAEEVMPRFGAYQALVVPGDGSESWRTAGWPVG